MLRRDFDGGREQTGRANGTTDLENSSTLDSASLSSLSAAWVGDVPRQTPHFLEAFLVVELDEEDEYNGVVKDASD